MSQTNQQQDPNENLRNVLKKVNYVEQFVREGEDLLKKTNRPNFITLTQFMPFISLFTMDEENQKRYKSDKNYEKQMNKLYFEFVKGLEINLYEPTIVIESQDNPKILFIMNRRFTRIKSDIVDKSHREKIPSNVPKTAPLTRDELLFNATIRDVLDANNTQEQKDYFYKLKKESALINQHFVRYNLKPSVKEDLENKVDNSESSFVEGIQFVVDDDDD